LTHHLPTRKRLTSTVKTMFEKLLLCFAILLTLGACAGPSSNGTDSTSRSGVQFYGTIDTGVGYQHTSK